MALEHSELTVEQTNGAARAQDTIEVHNPATGELIAGVPNTSDPEVAAAAIRGRRAQPAWEAIGFKARADVMYALRYWVMQNRERILDAIVAENGKTREDAMLAEVWYLCDSLGFWAKNAEKYLADEGIKTHSPLLMGKKVKVRYRPHELVGVIGPWNYPLTNGFSDCIPALMAGCSVLHKPSEVAPLATLLMQEGLEQAGLPEHVMQIVTGAGDTGRAVIDNVDMIMFTGSTATGKKVMSRAAERLLPVSLELGGKDPMIVCADADVERAANMAVQWGMSNSGQICISVERVYVEEPVYDDFVNRVVAKTRALRQGVPGQPGQVDIGAITFPPQMDKIEDHVQDAVDKGAQVLVGGKRRPGAGQFFEPTVMTGVDHTMKVMTDETFGPILPVMKVRDVEEAIRLSNDTSYGLNSSVFTKDVDKGERIARRLTAGSSCVNDALMNYLAQEAPFGGTGQSGIGARHGADGIRKYCSRQTILVTRFAMSREPTMYPNSAFKAKLFDRLMVAMWGRKPRKRA
jgi:acyl-CoA reductase-like NAD-dependent aldehyde dehydrogenase